MLKELLGRVFDLEKAKRLWKYYSTYAFLLIVGLPELVPQLIAALPEALGAGVAGVPVTRYMQIAAVGGLVLRAVRQASLEAAEKAKAAVDDEDQAGA